MTVEIHHATASNAVSQSRLPPAVHPGYVQIIQDDRVVGTLDAKFDFSEMPVEYQCLTLQVLNGHRIILPSARSEDPVESEGDKRPWWKFW